jgi:outer membrane protein OmpA-like peptidoglycan-associated protein
MTSSILWARSLTRIVAIAPLGMLLAACAQPASNGASANLAAAPANAGPAAAQPSTAPSDVQLFFDNGSTRLSAAANQKLDGAARLYREGNPIVMFVAGHADNTGGEYQNLLLSAERAKAAKDALVARGIPADRLQMQALGSSLPADPKAKPPEDNRRVVITWR